MANYICIDSGTSNTRISLVKEKRVIETKKFACGTKSSREVLIETLKNGISDIILKNGVKESEIEKILASGMITSELGLINLPHINAPAGKTELHNSLHQEVFPDISKIPFVFIRGVKTCSSELKEADMMRGEEAEIMGIMDGEGVYVLPGSHSKIITVNASEKITDFKTMLTGEMLSCLSSNTILKESITSLSGEIDEEFLFKGYTFAKENGINNALFKVRVLKNLYKANEAQALGFFMGAVLCDEINYILSLDCKKITVGGNAIIRKPMCQLLSKLSNAEIKALSDKEVDCSVIMGQIKIYE